MKKEITITLTEQEQLSILFALSVTKDFLLGDFCKQQDDYLIKLFIKTTLESFANISKKIP